MDYALTEDVAEKGQVHDRLKNTVAPVPNANTSSNQYECQSREEKKRERAKRRTGSGQRENEALGAYFRDTLHENGKLVLSFAEDIFYLLNIFLNPHTWCILHVPKCQLQQGPSAPRLPCDEEDLSVAFMSDLPLRNQ